MNPEYPILIVDDDEDMLRSYGYALRHRGFTHISQCLDSRKAEEMLKSAEHDLVLLDLNMPNISGRELLPKIVSDHPDMPVIVVTGVDDVRSAVACMKEGAFDYLVKPVDEDVLIPAVQRALHVRGIRRENSRLRRRILSPGLLHPAAFAELITANPLMHGLFQYVEAIAETRQSILITGETGVGKELVARALHVLSGMAGEFVPVNIAGLDDNVFSDTLFGHMKGAFTGAVEPRKGLIEKAAGGTLFLDEIGELNVSSQVKLLRLLQEREYLPLGSDVPRTTDARIIVATNRDLADLRQSANFRDDLFYRLRSHHVHIPPLRERLDDLPLLIDHFLGKAARTMNKEKPTPPRELVPLLRNHSFPGNIRELEGMVFNAVSTHRSGILSLETFKKAIDATPGAIRQARRLAEEAGLLFPTGSPLPTLKEAADTLISEALKRTSGNQTLAASLLGVTRQTINRHLRREQSD
jgi:DNA-binding NtrC family response regulator